MKIKNHHFLFFNYLGVRIEESGVRSKICWKSN